MKLLTRYSFVFLIGASSFSVTSMADTAAVNVSAVVLGTCRFDTGGTVLFNLDPSTTADAIGNVTQPQFWCTNGTSYTISDDLGLNESGTQRQMSNGTDVIPYSFTYTTSGSGAGKNSPITMDISAVVANSDFIDASVGAYSDTVTLTITP